RDAPRAEPSAPKPEAEAAAPPPPKPAAAPTPDRSAAPLRPRTPSRSVTEEGMKGFRDVIAEAEALGDATAQGAKTAREAYAATAPSGESNFNRVELRVEREGMSKLARPPAGPMEQPARATQVPLPNPIEPRAA